MAYLNCGTFERLGSLGNQRMATTAATSFVLFSLLLALASVSAVTLSPPSSSSSGGDADAGSNSTDFILSCCRRTRYPRLCFASLSSSSGKVGRDPVRLARTAADVALSRIQSLSLRLAALRREVAAAGGREAAALRDCCDTMGDAADLAQRSLRELGGLEGAVGPEVAWRVGNAQTWLSAAMTDEDTCSDGFEGVAGVGGVKGEVSVRVERVKHFTSNALALVNMLVNS
ncbi:pectinesterase inhibitor 9-like [Typha angustifolia]|uniref:pectinesterase inhibitor 9-like n=1 Tax=Typha angustifolia TaxID=59011 RepID=UPI003C2B3D67